MKEKHNQLKAEEIQNELKSVAFSYDQTAKRLAFLIFFLAAIALGISAYTLNYLLRFDADKIDTFVSENLKLKEADVEYSLPRIAVELLAQSKQKLAWNPSQKKWFFENASGKRVAYDEKYILVGSNQIGELERQFGITWNGDNWILPQELVYLRAK
jgi:hypothetical protein